MRVMLVTPVNPVTYQSIPDLGLGYLAAYLRRAGHQVDLVDCVNRGWDQGTLDAHARSWRPDVVGFKAYYTDIPSIAESVRRLSAALPATTFVVGGPHPSCVSPTECLETFPGCRFAFKGEAELGLPMLVAALVDLSDAVLATIPGLIWRDQAGRVHGNTGAVADDLDDVLPAWDLLRPRAYDFSQTFYSRNQRVAPIIATRGCPLPCTFCAAHQTSGKAIRHRSVDSVLREITLLQRDHDIEEISFIDDFFTGNKRFVRAFCQAVLDRGMRFDWACWGVRLTSLDEPLLRLMESAGCYAFSVGVESGSPRILAHMAKHLTVQQIEDKLALIDRVTDIRVGGLFIIGYPEETVEDVQQTIEFARRIPLFMATFYPFNPLPGTPIYDELRRSGELPQAPDWSTYGPEGFAYCPRSMEPATLRRLYRRAFLRFYTEPRRVRRLAAELADRKRLRFIATRVQRRLIGSALVELRGLRGGNGSWERATAGPAPSTLWPAI